MPKLKTKSKKLEISVLTTEGKSAGLMKLPSEIFTVDVNPKLLAQYVYVYLANQRSGSAATKTRSQVTGSTRKIYRQKGTGRARHGDIKAPIFIGGGIAHGPKPKDYNLRLTKKMRRKSLFGALTDHLESDCLQIVDGFGDIPVKTKKMVDILKNLKMVNLEQEPPKTLLVTDGKMANVYLSGRNLPYLTIKNADLINTYDILTHPKIIFAKEAIGLLTDTYLSKKEDQLAEKKRQVKTADRQPKISRIQQEITPKAQTKRPTKPNKTTKKIKK